MNVMTRVMRKLQPHYSCGNYSGISCSQKHRNEANMSFEIKIYNGPLAEISTGFYWPKRTNKMLDNVY